MKRRPLAIEIGGTKLQLGVFDGEAEKFIAWERRTIRPERGAVGIQQQILEVGSELIEKHGCDSIGIGFGGPVDEHGKIFKSHQIAGWDQFPLGKWAADQLKLPVRVGNDCDVATLAEASRGAGVGHQTVFYVTVGTGVGGGLCIGKQIHGRGRPAVAEIGHLRPTFFSNSSRDTVESLASGWGLANTAKRLLREFSSELPELSSLATDDLRFSPSLLLSQQLISKFTPSVREFVSGKKLKELTAIDLRDSALAGNLFAKHVLDCGSRTLGWAIAQVITLIAPNIVVVGGGVSLMGEELFFKPLRNYADEFSFGPLRGSCPIVAAQLGEEVVVWGAAYLGMQD